MAASTKSKTTSEAPADEDVMDDLLDGFGGEDIDPDDLLDEVEEDDSEGWVPKEKNEGISGLVVKVGQTRSDFAKDGEDPMVPTITIQTKDGSKFRVIGYGAVLRRELMDKNAHVGDLCAVKYFGEKLIRKGKFQGKPYKHFGVLVRHRSGICSDTQNPA
jgi:hypothetical protein